MTTKSAMRIESTDGRFWCKLIDWLGTHLVEKDSTTITLLLNGQEPAWHAKPTGPGLWVRSNGIKYLCATEHEQEWRYPIGPWFGPIPECDLKGGA